MVTSRPASLWLCSLDYTNSSVKQIINGDVGCLNELVFMANSKWCHGHVVNSKSLTTAGPTHDLTLKNIPKQNKLGNQIRSGN